MEKFIRKYSTDPGFREFIESTNKDEVICEFAYELYLKFGTRTISETYMLINSNLLDIDKTIKYFESIEEYEKAKKLTEIKKKINNF
jgi:hypothetical protein